MKLETSFPARVVNGLEIKPGADLHGADLHEENLSGMDLRHIDFTGANLQEAKLNGSFLNGADLKMADLERADLHGAKLNGANLYGANLIYANLQNAILANADLFGVDLHGAALDGADLRGAFHILSIGPIGSWYDILYAVQHAKTIMFKTGCFWGTGKELLASANETHGIGNPVTIQYRNALNLARVIFKQYWTFNNHIPF